MKKDGFVSMAVIYSFIIVFVVLMLSLLGAYAYRNKIIDSEISQIKEELNKEYQG